MGILLFFVYVFGSWLCHLVTGSSPTSLIFSGRIHTRVVEDATKYAHDMHHDWLEYVVECQPEDTNGDDYISCTIGNGHEAPEAIQCRSTVLRDGLRQCSVATNRVVVNHTVRRRR